MQYRLRIFEIEANAIREQVVQAESHELARAQHSRSGCAVLSVEELPEPVSAASQRATLDVAWWCRELRTLVAAGMTVVEALETLAAQPLGPARDRVNRELVQRLREGQSLSDAMRSVQAFPDVLVAGVKAGERTSSLVAALNDFLEYRELLDQLQRKIVSAAIYPAMVVGLGGVISVFLLTFVMPRFAAMYADHTGSLSTATQLLLLVSRGLANHGPWIAGAGAALAGVLVFAWRQGIFQRGAAAFAEALPWLRRQLDQFRLAKLYQCMALMFRGGYSLDEALRQAHGLGLGKRMQDSVTRAHAALQRGQRVSAVLGQAGLTDEVTQRLLAVGERTGEFDQVLRTIAQRHSANFATFIERSTRVVEPLLLLLVSLVVGAIVVMMYMPVFDIAASVR